VLQSRIILSEPEPNRDAAAAPTAPELMLNIGVKKSHKTATVSYLSYFQFHKNLNQ
jgi:hypothetical protein